MTAAALHFQTDGPRKSLDRPRLGRPTALLVDPVPERARPIRQRLEAFGFAVKTARSASHARWLAQRVENPLDLLVADADLPDGPADTLAGSLRERHPGLRTLYTSRLTRAELHAAGFRDLDAPVLSGVPSRRALAEQIRRVLGL